MDLNYTDDQAMLRDSVERFLREEYAFESFAKIAQSDQPFNPAIWKQFAELGWLAMPISEANGGLGGGPVETAIIAEQLGRSLVLEPYVGIVVLAGGLIDRLGTQAQCEQLLGRLIAGEGWAALAHDERAAGADVSLISTRAEKVGESYRITGGKTAVLGGVGAETLLVSALIGETIGLFIVPIDAPGLTVSPYRTAEGGQAADVALDGVMVGVDALLGDEQDAQEAIDIARDHAAAAASWDAVGAMDALLAGTIAFLKDRSQFGKPLSALQALRHRVAEMAVQCAEARGIALLASLSVDAPADKRVRGVSGAKAKIGKVSRQVAHEAIQLHGSMGFTDELAIGWWYKRLFVFEHLHGTTREHLARYGAIVTRPEIQAESLLQAPDAR